MDEEIVKNVTDVDKRLQSGQSVIVDKNSENSEKYLEESNKRLMNISTKKIMTTMIGALSKFEEDFGYLWGRDKEDDLTAEELEIKNKWDSVRAEILSLGNNQIKNLKEEFTYYTIKWNRYHIEFRMVK